MGPIRVKSKALFAYSDDGIRAVTLLPGQVLDAHAHLVPGLLAADLVEETDEPVTPPEKVAELRAGFADAGAEAGITPWQGVRTGEHEPTLVGDEHLEPVRRRGLERHAARRSGVPATTERHADGTKDSPVQVPAENVVQDPADVEDDKDVPDYATKDERPAGRKRRGAV